MKTPHSSINEIKSAKILLVDSDEPNIWLLGAMLLQEGYLFVTIKNDPFEVCSLHAIHKFDLILLDMQMIGTDGIELMENLKNTEELDYVPIMVINSEPRNTLNALNCGAKDILCTPIDFQEASIKIHNLLDVHLFYKNLEFHSRTMEACALLDSLTGLPNRRLFIDRLELAIAHAQRVSSSITVIYLDLDGFKKVNDRLGHEAGDILLKTVADRLISLVRKEDTVSRFGGDEFVLLLRELGGTEGLDIVITKVLNALSEPFCINGVSLKISASAGVSSYPEHGQDIEVLIKKADAALYRSKGHGKNRYNIALLGTNNDSNITDTQTAVNQLELFVNASNLQKQY